MPLSASETFEALRPAVLIDGIPDQEAIIVRVFRASQVDRPLYTLAGEAKALKGLEFTSRHSAALALVDYESLRIELDHLVDIVRNMELLRSTPKVLMLQSDSGIDLQETYRKGFNSILVKPESEDGLRSMVDDVFRYWLNLNRSPL